MKLKAGLRLAAPLLLAASLAACASAKTYTYTLSAVPPAAATHAGRPLHPPIEVGEVGIPATIDRDSIVLSAPGDHLEVLPNSVWGAPVRQLIRRALSDDLTARLPPGSVLPPGTSPPRGGLRIVTVEVQRFEGSTSGHVVLDAAWTVARSGSAPTGIPRMEQVTVNAGSGNPDAVVPAMSAALGKLADRIAAALR